MFTDAKIRTLKGSAEQKQNTKTGASYWPQRDYLDTDGPVRGFCVRVSGAPGDETRTFMLLYRTSSGQQKRLKIGRYPEMPLRDARSTAMKALGDVARGLDPCAARQEMRAAGTFRELAKEYIERHAKPRKRSWENDERMIEKDLNPLFGSRKAREITRRDVQALLERLMARGPALTRVMQALISKLFYFGVERGWLDSNPCQRMERFSPPSERNRVLTPDELRKIDAACVTYEDQTRAAIIRLMPLTGQRHGEIRQMQFSDLEIPAGALSDDGSERVWWTIRAEVAKNGRQHRVPLSKGAVNLLRPYIQSRRAGCEWVFPRPDRQNAPYTTSMIEHVADHISETAGVDDFRLHDLRRPSPSTLL